MAKYFGCALLKCDINSKMKGLKHGPDSVVAGLQDEKTDAERRHMYSPHPRIILMCYRANSSSYPVGNEALFRVKSDHGMKLTTDVLIVRSPKVINEFKYTPRPCLFMALLT
jgi:hypothetical protein